MINKKEILANGKLFDIVRTVIINGKTCYYAVADEEEDEYQLQLTDWEKNNSQENSFPGKTISLHLIKYFTAKNYLNSTITHLPTYPEQAKNNSDSFLYKSPFENIFSPPPNTFLS